MKERLKIIGRKGIREIKSVKVDMMNEVKDAVNKIKNSKNEKITVSDVGQITGIATAIGLQVVLTALAGPMDYLINAAVAMITVPLKDYNFSFINPIYKTTTKPFLDEIINRHHKKAEGIIDTAKSLKKDLEKVNANTNKYKKSEYDKIVNDIIKNMKSLGSEIDRFRYKMQRELTKIEVKIQLQKNIIDENKKHEVSNENAYNKLNKLKGKKQSLNDTMDFFDKNIKKHS
jgi:hypothetical protein